MKKPVTIIAQYRCLDFDDTNIEYTKKCAWLSKTQCGIIATVKGVPSSILDLLIVVDKPIEDYVRVIELAHKEGKYDGEIRKRLTFRYMPQHQAPLQCVAVWVECTDAIASVHIGNDVYKFGRWKSELDHPEKIEKIVRWHFDRYYKFLNNTDIQCIAKDLVMEVITGKCTLAEANRIASRLLYKCARDQGFRKLTKREQLRLGLSG
jgi:predicted nucleotidyltransferase